MRAALSLAWPGRGPVPRHTATVGLNGKPVVVAWTDRAERRLAAQAQPLVVELELYLSCLVKKFVHFHDEPPARPTVAVTDRLQLVFRVVTSTACSMELAERLGRQPETEVDTPVAHRLAPSRVELDFAGGRWRAEFWL